MSERTFHDGMKRYSEARELNDFKINHGRPKTQAGQALQHVSGHYNYSLPFMTLLDNTMLTLSIVG